MKGRRFPTGKSYWKNWVTAEELQSLASWEALFGQRFSGLLVFAYNVVGELAPLPASDLFPFRGGLYGFVGIRLEHYASWSRPLSARWGTVSVPTGKFRSLAQGLDALLRSPLSKRCTPRGREEWPRPFHHSAPPQIPLLGKSSRLREQTSLPRRPSL